MNMICVMVMNMKTDIKKIYFKYYKKIDFKYYKNILYLSIKHK